MKKTPEEILKNYLSDNYFALKEQDLKPLILQAMQEYATQCQQDNAELIKEVIGKVKIINDLARISDDRFANYSDTIYILTNEILTTLNKQ